MLIIETIKVRAVNEIHQCFGFIYIQIRQRKSSARVAELYDIFI
jgi:hypothetical protein